MTIVFDILLGLLSIVLIMIYEAISIVTDGMIAVVNTDFFSDSFITDFRNRVYIVLAIYMLFRISISVVGFILNPDSFSDKDRGFGKLIQRTIFSLMMLVMSPVVFREMTLIQKPILEAVPRIVTGNAIGNNFGSAAQNISLTAFSAFVTYKECPGQNPPDNDFVDLSGEGVTGINRILLEKCSNGNSQYRYDVNWFLAIIAGIFMLFIIIGYSLDIAIRGIKLGILQLLAPIPIISYIDPKDKGNVFNNWFKEYISVYVELFIKMGVFYFVIEILAAFGTGDLMVVNSSSILATLYAKVFIIMGTLFFLSDASKFICDIFGIKSSGGGLFGGLGKVLGAAGIGAAAVGGGILAGKAAFGGLGPNAGFKDKAGAVAKTIGGVFGGGVNGFKNMDAGDGSFKGAIGAGINAFGTPGRLKGDLSEKLSKQKSKYDDLMEYAGSESKKRYSNEKYKYTIGGKEHELSAADLAYYQQQSGIPNGDTDGIDREWFRSDEFSKIQKEIDTRNANRYIKDEYDNSNGDKVLKFKIEQAGLCNSAKEGNGYAAAKEQSDVREQKITLLNSKSSK